MDYTLKLRFRINLASFKKKKRKKPTSTKPSILHQLVFRLGPGHKHSLMPIFLVSPFPIRHTGHRYKGLREAQLTLEDENAMSLFIDHS